MQKIIIKNDCDFSLEYLADDSGHIYSPYKKGFMTEHKDKDGYLKVNLSLKNKGRQHPFPVHRLILETFVPVEDMDKLQVDHIDGDKTNNNINNLRWTTCKENINNPNTLKNARANNQNGAKNLMAKFNAESILHLINDCNSGEYKQKEILEKYNINRETLRKILNRISYIQETENLVIAPNFIQDYSRDVSGEKNPKSKLTESQVLEIVDKIKQGLSYPVIAAEYNVSVSTISSIKRKKTWKELTKNIEF